MMLKLFANTLVKPVLSRYLQRERSYSYKGFNLTVFPGVFHPAFFFSTKYLFGFIDRLDLKGKKALEIGSGAGLISLLMARKQALVTAIDISRTAVENTLLNFRKNKMPLGYSIIQSDLFDQLPGQLFDVIVINPPYFFQEVKTESQHAWNCGSGGEYFVKLFSSLAKHIAQGGAAYMILADNCDIKRISQIAHENHFTLMKIEEKKIWWEINFIYLLEPGPSLKIG